MNHSNILRTKINRMGFYIWLRRGCMQVLPPIRIKLNTTSTKSPVSNSPVPISNSDNNKVRVILLETDIDDLESKIHKHEAEIHFLRAEIRCKEGEIKNLE
ncbi:hypothetical protein EDC94DRAFT_649511 [Helicostylum pulchrum]|nr:hypothetical protein EDC94DRAFT_649511 [Helicostylum pulchrum]